MLFIAVLKKVAVTLKLPRKFIDRRIGTVKGPSDPANHLRVQDPSDTSYSVSLITPS